MDVQTKETFIGYSECYTIHLLHVGTIWANKMAIGHDKIFVYCNIGNWIFMFVTRCVDIIAAVNVNLPRKSCDLGHAFSSQAETLGLGVGGYQVYRTSWSGQS